MAKSMAKVAKGRKKKHVCVRKQAPALTRKVWEAWMQFVKMNARLWIYFCLFLTGALGLRCGEALVADGQDFALEAETPNLKVTGKNPGGQKSPGCVYVPQKAFRLIKKAFTTGITVTREIKAKNGQVKKRTETFKAKKKGFIFPSRKGSKDKHMSYQAVYNVVRKLAPKFVDHLLAKKVKHDAPLLRTIRPHSGRATFITQLMNTGVSLAHSMKAARHSPSPIRVHLRYGQLTLEDVRAALEKPLGRGAMMDMSVKELRKTVTEAKAELRRRGLRG